MDNNHAAQSAEWIQVRREFANNPKLNTREAITRMVEKSGLKKSEVGARLGHQRAYITTLQSMPSTQTVKTLLGIADVCGYEIVLRSIDEEIVLVDDEDDSDTTSK